MNADRGHYPDTPRPRPDFIGMPPGMQTEIDTVTPADGADAGEHPRAQRPAVSTGEIGVHPHSAEPVTLVFDDGTPEVELSGPVLLGRDPARSDRFPQARPYALVDSARSVSKTHVLVDVSGGGAWVIDLGSTNGTAVVDAHGRETVCVPGVPTAVPEWGGFAAGNVGVQVREAPSESGEPYGAW